MNTSFILPNPQGVCFLLAVAFSDGISWIRRLGGLGKGCRNPIADSGAKDFFPTLSESANLLLVKLDPLARKSGLVVRKSPCLETIGKTRVRPREEEQPGASSSMDARLDAVVDPYHEKSPRNFP
jgi:hypothetical protein